MDPAVQRSLAKWPGVPAVYGWLALDRRGNWLMREPDTGAFSRIANAALRDFIGRNYAADPSGCWYFQNGPQRVFVKLAYTPLVIRAEGGVLIDHCGDPVRVQAMFVDDEGSLLVQGQRGIGVLDDRDLALFAQDAHRFETVAKREVPGRFGFVPDPGNSLR